MREKEIEIVENLEELKTSRHFKIRVNSLPSR